MGKTTVNLRILATTDLHAHMLNFDYFQDKEVANRGLVALADLIEKARAEAPNTLLFDNGDLLQGDPLGDYSRDFSLQYHHPIYTLMNELKYDGANLGNHEFNFGLPFLKAVLSQANFPYICANLIKEDGQPWIAPYQLLNRTFKATNGEDEEITIGIVGVLPPQVPEWDQRQFELYAKSDKGYQLKATDILETISYYIPRMKAEGADIIILLAHSGFSLDPYEERAEDCANYLTEITGVDVLIAGHAHQAFPSPYFSKAKYKKAGFNAQSGLINGIPSVMPGSWARYLGVIDLELTKEKVKKEEASEDAWCVENPSAVLWALKEKREATQALNPHYLSLLKPAHEEVRQLMNTTMGESKTAYYSYLSFLQDDACLQIIAEAQLERGKKELEKSKLSRTIKSLPLITAVPLFKVGGRKDDPNYFTQIAKGPITFKDVADLYVFPNELVIIQLTGREVREWLECAASMYHTLTPNKKRQPLINWAGYRAYNVDILKGINYQIDLSQPPRYNGDTELCNTTAHRITHLTTPKGEPITNEMEFLLVTNSHRGLIKRFPGAGKENAVLITPYEIPQIINRYVRETINTHGYLETYPEMNWSFDMGTLGTISLILESSNAQNCESYINENALYPSQKIGTDKEGFSLFEFSVN